VSPGIAPQWHPARASRSHAAPTTVPPRQRWRARVPSEPRPHERHGNVVAASDAGQPANRTQGLPRTLDRHRTERPFGRHFYASQVAPELAPDRRPARGRHL